MPSNFAHSLPAPNSSDLAMLPRQLAERHRQVDAEVAAERLERLAHQLAIAARPRRDRAIGERLRLVRHDAARIEIDHRAEPLAVRHAPCGELKENARGVISGMLRPQSTHASRRENSRSPSSYELMTTMSSARLSATSIDSVRRRSMPPRTISAIDDDVDGVVAAPIELDVLFERSELAVDPRLGEAARPAAPRAPS